MAKKYRYRVSVQFECEVPLKPAAVREYVETALKVEIGGRNPESPLKEIDKRSIRVLRMGKEDVSTGAYGDDG